MVKVSQEAELRKVMRDALGPGFQAKTTSELYKVLLQNPSGYSKSFEVR